MFEFPWEQLIHNLDEGIPQYLDTNKISADIRCEKKAQKLKEEQEAARSKEAFANADRQTEDD